MQRNLASLPADFWIGAGCTVAAAIGIALIRVDVGALTAEKSVLPLMGAGGCLLLGLCLSAQAWRDRVNGGSLPEEGGESEAAEPLTRANLFKLAAAVVAVFVHALLLEELGLLIAGLSLQAILFLLVGIRNLGLIALVSLSSVGVIYFGISGLLGVPLPEGSLLQWMAP